MTRVTLIHGDVLDRCGELEEGSFDAVLCDPPYGLSGDSAQGVGNRLLRALSNVVLPNLDELEPGLCEVLDLAGIPLNGSRLSRAKVRMVVEPGVRVPEGTVHLDHGADSGKQEINTGDESATGTPESDLPFEDDPSLGEFVGHYVLDARDALDLPAGDVAGSGIAEFGASGFRVPIVTTLLPGRDCPLSSLLLSGSSGLRDGVSVDDDSRGQSSRTASIVTGAGAVVRAVLRFDLGGGAINLRPAGGADDGDRVPHPHGAKLVRALPRAGSLPSMAKPHPVRVILDSADGTQAFYLALWLPHDWLNSLKSIPLSGGFMGRRWDHGVPSAETWAAVLRLLKPGAPLVAFGGTRTYHRLAVAVEDAGFEIRDSLLCGAWVTGQGFPKSLDIGKAIDKRPGVSSHQEFAAALTEARTNAGLSRADVSEAVVGSRSGACWNWEHHQFPEYRHWKRLAETLPDLDRGWGAVLREAERKVIGKSQGSNLAVAPGQGIDRSPAELPVTAPATPEAARWEGYGTALKPAWEPAVVAQAPLDGTFAENALAHGVAGLNVDGGRVGTDGGTMAVDFGEVAGTMYGGGAGKPKNKVAAIAAGRWPSNLLLCHHPQCREVGTRKVAGSQGVRGASTRIYGGGKGFTQKTGEAVGYADPDGTETVTAWDCHPSCPVAGLDRQSGEAGGGFGISGGDPDGHGIYSSGFPRGDNRTVGFGDSGGASRFYFQASFDGADFLMYHAKAASSERRIGMPPGEVCRHPTLKPISLMAYLAKLLLPPERPDGAPRRLLVPFAGAGSEIIGACRAGWEEVVGIELEAEHVEWARMRVEGDAPLFNVVTVESEEGDTE